MYQQLAQLLFEQWMEEEHPYYQATMGWIFILLGVGILTSAILLFFVTWWWKLSILFIVLLLILIVVNKIMMQVFADEFLQSKKK